MKRLLAILLLSALAAHADEASRLYQEGVRAERQGDDLKAYTLFTRAAGLRPEEPKYRGAAEKLRMRAAQSLAAFGKLDEALALDPGNGYLQAERKAGSEEPEGALSIADIREAEQLAPPVELQPAPGRHSFSLRGDARQLYEQVTRAYKIEVVFDQDFTPGPAISFRMQDVDFREAFRALMALTNSFMIPIHERVALVAKDTQQKRSELEPMVARVLPIPQAISVEEVNEIGRAVQQALDIKRLSVDSVRRQVLVRDTVTRVRLATALYEELARRRAEVMIDIDLLAVSHSALTNLGLTLPTSLPVSFVGDPVSLGRLGAIDLPMFGVQIGDARFQADLLRSEGQVLSSFRVRATDGLPANLHIGDRFPIVNAIFSPIVITEQIRDLDRQGLLRQPFPSFTFEDLGLVLKVTPRVHDSHEITLTMEAEFKLLTGANFNGVPVIASRKFNSAVRVTEGETSVVSGLAVMQVSHSRSGFPGLSQIPVVAAVLSRNTWQRDRTELLITVTPRLTSLPPAEQFVQRTLHYGTETRPVSPI